MGYLSVSIGRIRGCSRGSSEITVIAMLTAAITVQTIAVPITLFIIARERLLVVAMLGKATAIGTDYYAVARRCSHSWAPSLQPPVLADPASAARAVSNYLFWNRCIRPIRRREDRDSTRASRHRLLGRPTRGCIDDGTDTDRGRSRSVDCRRANPSRSKILGAATWPIARPSMRQLFVGCESNERCGVVRRHEVLAH